MAKINRSNRLIGIGYQPPQAKLPPSLPRPSTLPTQTCLPPSHALPLCPHNSGLVPRPAVSGCLIVRGWRRAMVSAGPARGRIALRRRRRTAVSLWRRTPIRRAATILLLLWRGRAAVLLLVRRGRPAVVLLRRRWPAIALLRRRRAIATVIGGRRRAAVALVTIWRLLLVGRLGRGPGIPAATAGAVRTAMRLLFATMSVRR